MSGWELPRRIVTLDLNTLGHFGTSAGVVTKALYRVVTTRLAKTREASRKGSECILVGRIGRVGNKAQ